MSLFTIDLGRELTYPMVLNFLRLADPPEHRPQEGLAIDYNEEIPRDLGDVVAAFSNTAGGLVILGVKEDKQHSLAIPDTVPGLSGTTEAIKGTIVNILSSTVTPRPTFYVGIVPAHQPPNTFVAVIRVAEGMEPPYMFTASERNKISVRIGDSNRPASLEQVKNLFEKAARLRERLISSVSLGDFYLMRNNTRSGAYHQLTWVPFDHSRLHLDSRAEVLFRKAISETFRRDDMGKVTVERDARATELDLVDRAGEYHRKWRVIAEGGIGFVSHLARLHPAAQHPQEIARIGDWIEDALCFVRLAQRWSETIEHFGTALLTHCMSFTGARELTLEPVLSTHLDSFDQMRSVVVPSTVPSRSLPTVREADVTLRQFDDNDVTELLARFFLYQLRDLGAWVDWQKLCDEIRYLQGV